MSIMDSVRKTLAKKGARDAAGRLEELQAAMGDADKAYAAVRSRVEDLKQARKQVVIDGPDAAIEQHDLEIERAERQRDDALTVRDELQRQINQAELEVAIEAAVSGVPQLTDLLATAKAAMEAFESAQADLREHAHRVQAGYERIEGARRLEEVGRVPDELQAEVERMASFVLFDCASAIREAAKFPGSTLLPHWVQLRKFQLPAAPESGERPVAHWDAVTEEWELRGDWTPAERERFYRRNSSRVTRIPVLPK